MKDHGSTTQNVITFYTFCLGGLIFAKPPFSERSPASAMLFSVLSASALCFLICAVFGRIKPSESPSETICDKRNTINFLVLPLAAVIIFSLASGAAASEFAHTIAVISKEFSFFRFRHLFVFLSFVLAVFLSDKGCGAFSRACVIFLPLLFFCEALSLLAFVSKGTVSFPPAGEISFDLSYLRYSAFLVCDTVFILFLMRIRKGAGMPDAKALRFAFLIFVPTLAVRILKFILFFDKAALPYIERPDFSMLGLIPDVNVRELFFLEYYVSFILKCTVYASMVKFFSERFLFYLFPSVSGNKRGGYAVYTMSLISVFSAYEMIFASDFEGSCCSSPFYTVPVVLFFSFCIFLAIFRNRSHKH